MSKKPATMRDIARNAVEALDFIPNISARTLKYGQSHAIGAMVPDPTNPFFSEFLREFHDALEDLRSSQHKERKQYHVPVELVVRQSSSRIAASALRKR